MAGRSSSAHAEPDVGERHRLDDSNSLNFGSPSRDESLRVQATSTSWVRDCSGAPLSGVRGSGSIGRISIVDIYGLAVCAAGDAAGARSCPRTNFSRILSRTA